MMGERAIDQRRQAVGLSSGRSAVSHYTLAGLAFAFVGVLLVWSLLHPRFEGDTNGVVWGSDAARSCLSHGPLTGCPGVYYFPLLQYLPAMALGAIGVGDRSILRVLAVISTLCLAGILVLAWRIVSRYSGRGAAAIVVSVLAAGPLLWYARSTFGEMLAAFLMLLFAEAVLARRGPLAVGATLWLAGITKETALPFLLVLGAVALLAPIRGKLRLVRAQLWALGLGGVLVFATNAGFNLFRFDSIWNTWNLRPLYRVPGLDRKLQIAVAIWAAPNGGLLFFWSLAVLLGVVTLAWAVRRRDRAGPPRWPAWVLIGVGAWLTAGFASWYAPFGWNAWGPRLEMPWIPVLLVLATVLYPHRARAIAAWIGATGARRVAAGLLVALVALPHVAALFGTDPLFRLFGPDRVCPVPVVMEQVSVGYAYGCLHHVAWAKTPVLADALRSLGGGTAFAFAVLLAISAVSAFLVAPLGRSKQ
jgi:hypothetical protein